MTLTFRRARVDETQNVVDLLHARVDWLRDRGLDQWSNPDPARNTDESIAVGETWVLVDGNDVVASSTMTTVGHPGFWTDDELKQPSLYLSKMATWPRDAGRGLGRTLLDCSIRYAASRSISRLRWDAWKTNDELHRYYVNQGARYLRTVDLPDGWNSGALFECAYQAPTETVTNLEAPLELFATLSSERQSTSTGLAVARESHRGWASPADHWHVAHDLEYGNLGTTDETDLGPAMINSDAETGPILFNSGSGWRAGANGRTQPAAGPALTGLRPGHVYRLRHIESGPTGCGVAIMGDALSSANAAQAVGPES